MRAVVIDEIGQRTPRLIEDARLPEMGVEDVRVAIRAAGVCHSDLSAMGGALPQAAPFALGHEGAGEVLDVGPGVDTVKPGDRVVIAWVIPCMACATCLRGQTHLCSVPRGGSRRGPFAISSDGVGYYGFAGSGVATFADEAVLPARAVIKIPQTTPFDIAAIVGCGVTTGVGAVLNAAEVRPGDRACIIGIGGVGIAAVQAAVIAGATDITAVDIAPDKLVAARGFGATRTVDASETDQIAALAREGFDHVIEVVGIPQTIRQAYDLTRRGGTCVVVGAGSVDDKVEFSAFELFYSEKNLRGSVYGSSDPRRDIPRLLALEAAGLLDLAGMISQRLPLERVGDGLAALSSGQTIRTVIEL